MKWNPFQRKQIEWKYFCVRCDRATNKDGFLTGLPKPTTTHDVQYRTCFECAPRSMPELYKDAPPLMMTQGRRNYLERVGEKLDKIEIDAGWHYCKEWDGMLINKVHPEYDVCTCFEE